MLPSLTLFASAYLSISSNQEHQGRGSQRSNLSRARRPRRAHLHLAVCGTVRHAPFWPGPEWGGRYYHLRFLCEQILISISVRIRSLLACLNYSPMMSKESPSPVYMATLATSLKIIDLNQRCRRQDKEIDVISPTFTRCGFFLNVGKHLGRSVTG